MARIANHTSEETKENIQNTFIEFYKDYDFSKITVNMICKKAGINRGTFYYYYSDIYDLLLNIEMKALDKLKDIFPVIVNATLFEDYDDLGKITSFIENTGDIFVLFFETRPNLHFQQKIRRYTIDYLVNRFGVEIYDLSLKQQCILEYFIHGQISSMVWWIKSGQTVPIEKFFRIIYDINHCGPLALLSENDVFDIKK